MQVPSPDQYVGAIQSPAICFGDPQLKSGSVVLNRLGLPNPTSGSFAVVFQIRNNAQSFAVRCFTTHRPDYETRYREISAYLTTLKLPYFAQFEYLDKGIRVNGSWYPIVKMEWVEGEPMPKYVEKHLTDKAALLDLAKQFATLTTALERHSLAHGDLQHGNILVSSGKLRLVDYDGMYVPALGNLGSAESGHANYQHPSRTTQWGPHLDRFSSWIIFYSLIALSLDPNLWYRLQGGDDCLLLRRDDFVDPLFSSRLEMLDEVALGGSVTIASKLRAMLAQPDLLNLPALDTSVIESLPSRKITAALPGWVAEALDAGQSVDPLTNTASWIIESLPVENTLRFPTQLSLTERWMTRGSIAVLAGTVWLFAINIELGIVSALVSLILVIVTLRWMYSKMPVVVEATGVKEHYARARRMVEESNAAVLELRKEHEVLNDSTSTKIKGVQQQRVYSEQQYRQAMQAIDARMAAQSAALQLREAKLTAAEQAELARVLTEIRNDAFLQYLTLSNVNDANIYGVSPKLKSVLARYGIRTAADISGIWGDIVQARNGQSYKIPGIGPVKAMAIKLWWDNLVSEASRKVPQSLDRHREQLIRAPYDKERNQIQSEAFQVKESANRDRTLAKEQRRKEDERSKSEQLRLQAEADALQKKIVSRVEEVRSELRTHKWKLEIEKRRLDSTSNVTFRNFVLRLARSSFVP